MWVKKLHLFRQHDPVVLVSSDLNPHKHNIWTPYVHLFTFLQSFSRSIRPSSGRKRKYVNGKVCCGSLFHSTLFHLCSCVFCLMMMEWNNRKIFRKVNKWNRSQWPRGLRRRSLAARLLRLWVRIPPGAWIFVCCECCVLSGRGLCDGLIIRSEESYRMWRVAVCDQETSYARRLKPTRGL